MRKFKLVKCYPGSPELGAVCEERNVKSSFCYYFEGEKNLGILKDQVENQTEYWEEVKDNAFTTICFETDGTIKTIKRHSDNAYFSVGDWFYPTKEKLQPNIILELKYVLNGAFRVFGTNSCVSLDMISPTKNKAAQYELNGNLFYSWDKVWGVHPKSFKKNFVKYGREEDGVPVYYAYAQNDFMWFKSKEEAKSFIIHNKPCLSFNEVRGLVGHGFFGSTSHQKLFELVKSRI